MGHCSGPGLTLSRRTPGSGSSGSGPSCQLSSGPHVEALLGEATPDRPADRAAYHRIRGALAEQRWQPRDALRHTVAAVAARPSDPELLSDLIRVRLLLLDIGGATEALGRYGAVMAPVARLERRSANISQTQFGQQIDEYRLDEVLPLLFRTAALPDAGERARLLRPFVRHYPDSTALAISLMLAMRQAGAFAARPPGGDGAVPLRLAQLRHHAGPSPDLDRLAQSWTRNTPGIEHTIFDMATAKAFLAERTSRPTQRAFSRAVDPAQRSDVFHLAWLATEGGIVADPATRCLGPAGALLPPGADLVVVQGAAGSLETDFIAARAGHSVIELALDEAVAAINRGDNDTRWLSTGPALLTRVFVRLVPVDTADVAPPHGAVALDRTELSQVVATGCATLHRPRQRATMPR